MTGIIAAHSRLTCSVPGPSGDLGANAQAIVKPRAGGQGEGESNKSARPEGSVSVQEKLNRALNPVLDLLVQLPDLSIVCGALGEVGHLVRCLVEAGASKPVPD